MSMGNTGRRFKCPYCESTFSFKNNLKTHAKRYHTELFENTDFSKVEFGVIDEKKQSNQVQNDKTKFQCLSCDCNYSKKDVLDNHIISCHGQKNYETNLKKLLKCPSCDYRPLRKEHLRRHIKNVHQFEKTKLLKCPSCDYKPLRREHLMCGSCHIRNVLIGDEYRNWHLYCVSR
jgi:hypothetical protein